MRADRAPRSRRGLAGLVTLAAAACGRLDFATQPVTMDAGADAGPRPGPDAPCPLGPWGTPRELTELNTAERDWGPFLRADRLELLFSRRVGGVQRLFQATRTSVDAPFADATELTALNTGTINDNPFLDRDGLRLWFDSDGEVMTTTRPALDRPFAPATPVDELNSADEDVSFALAPDGAAWLASSRGALDLDLYRAAPLGPDTFAPPVRQTTLNSPLFDCCPTFADDGTLWFATEAGLPAVGIVTASPVGAGWSSPTPFAPTDLGGQETDPWVSADGATLLFSADDSLGSPGLWIVERPCLR